MTSLENYQWLCSEHCAHDVVLDRTLGTGVGLKTKVASHSLPHKGFPTTPLG